MQDDEKRALSSVRLEHADECLAAAKSLLESGAYKSAANRAYYTVFHSMRAVLAMDEFDTKRHSGIISEFRKRYIRTGLLDGSLSDIITATFDARTGSDYNDFYVISKSKVEKQVRDAETFLCAIKDYLQTL